MSDRDSCFLDRALRGDVTSNAIDDFVDEWHEGSFSLPLHAFLGMTFDEYRLWAVAPSAIPDILAARRSQRGLDEVVRERLARLRQTGRMEDHALIHQLEAWSAARVDTGERAAE